jgi:hypothetical protein
MPAQRKELPMTRKRDAKAGAVGALLLLLIAAAAGAASGEVYTWTDGEGVHYSDNLGSVPAKFREQAAAEATATAEQAAAPLVIDLKEHPELISASPGKERHRVAKKAKQFRRGQRLGASESIGIDKKEGCYLSYSVQPGPSTHWTPNSYSTGAMKMNVVTAEDCLQDCQDNAQQQALSAAKGWQVLGSCYYNGETLSSALKY